MEASLFTAISLVQFIAKFSDRFDSDLPIILPGFSDRFGSDLVNFLRQIMHRLLNDIIISNKVWFWGLWVLYSWIVKYLV